MSRFRRVWAAQVRALVSASLVIRGIVGMLFDFFQDLCIFFLKPRTRAYRADCSFCASQEIVVESAVKQKGGSCRKVSFFMPEQDVQQGAADPGVGEFSGFQEITEGTPGGKIFSPVDDAVGEILADIQVRGQGGGSFQKQAVF